MIERPFRHFPKINERKVLRRRNSTEEAHIDDIRLMGGKQSGNVRALGALPRSRVGSRGNIREWPADRAETELNLEEDVHR